MSVDNICENYVDLKVDDKYEINRDTLTIRKKSNEVPVKPYICKQSGYYVLYLSLKKYTLHCVIAEQFLIKPGSTERFVVKHLNGNKTDNRVENLMYVSLSECCQDLSKCKHVAYAFVDKLPEGSILVPEYCNSYFENLFYCSDKFYLFTGRRYRIMHENKSTSKQHNGDKYILLRNCGGDYIKIYYSIFKDRYYIPIES
jgi:hypothetical protein